MKISKNKKVGEIIGSRWNIKIVEIMKISELIRLGEVINLCEVMKKMILLKTFF